MEKKKTKLTLSRGTKQPVKDFGISKSLGKNTVIIDRKSQKPHTKGSYSKNTGVKKPYSGFKKIFYLNQFLRPKVQRLAVILKEESLLSKEQLKD